MALKFRQFWEDFRKIETLRPCSAPRNFYFEGSTNPITLEVGPVSSLWKHILVELCDLGFKRKIIEKGFRILKAYIFDLDYYFI